MLHKRLNQEAGQSLIEYTVLLGLLALVVLSSVALLGERVGAQLAAVDNALARIVQADASTPELPPQDDADDEDEEDGEGDEDGRDEDTSPAKPGRPIRPLPPERPEKPWFPWLAWPW